jgi:hypothetical protein
VLVSVRLIIIVTRLTVTIVAWWLSHVQLVIMHTKSIISVSLKRLANKNANGLFTENAA